MEFTEEEVGKALDLEAKKPKRKIKLRQGLCAILAFLHFTACGILTAFASILIAQLEEDSILKVTPEQATWIVSIFILPMPFASLLAGILMRKVSKRSLLVTITLIEIIGWLTIYFSATHSVYGIMAGRFIIGISSSMGSPIIPSLIGETTNPKYRPVYISSTFFGLSFGILLIHVLAAYLKWTTCIFISIGLEVIFFIIAVYLKETYAWYLIQHDVYQAKKAFHWYRGYDEDAKREISQLIDEHDRIAKENDDEETNRFVVWWEYTKKCLNRSLLMPLFITITLMATMHLSGFKIIAFYSISMMKSVVPTLDKYTSTIIVDVIRLIATLIGSYLVGRFPLRMILLTSGIGSILGHLLFAVSKLIANESSNSYLSVLSLVALVIYISFSTFGLGVVPWVICGEIFPLAYKGVGTGISWFFYFVVFFITIKFVPLLEFHIGITGEFIFFACATAIGVTILYRIMPETRNRTLQEIEDLFR